MPKMKTKSGAKKRFRVRPGGTVKRGQAFKRHILTKKSTRRTRRKRLPLSSGCGLGINGKAGLGSSRTSPAKGKADESSKGGWSTSNSSARVG